MSVEGPYRFLIRGRVQGVGFRWFVLRAATRLELTGTVRNLPDGQVEVCVAGTPQGLATFELELAKGPPSARVEHVEKEKLPHKPHQFKSFEVL